MTSVKRAIISVKNPEGLTELATFLSTFGIDIYTTGDNALLLKNAGLTIFDTAETGLAPLIVQKMNSGDTSLDLVIVDFPENVRTEGFKSLDFELETLIRFAIRNYKYTIIITHPSMYSELRETLAEKGTVSISDRLSFLQFTLQTMVKYDIALSQYFLGLYTAEVKKERFDKADSEIEKFRERQTQLIEAIKENVNLSEQSTQLLDKVEEIEEKLEQQLNENPDNSSPSLMTYEEKQQFESGGFSDASADSEIPLQDDELSYSDPASDVSDSDFSGNQESLFDAENKSSDENPPFDENLPVYKSNTNTVRILLSVIAVLFAALIYFMFFRSEDDSVTVDEKTEIPGKKTDKKQVAIKRKIEKQTKVKKSSVKTKSDKIPAHLLKNTGEKEQPTDNRLVKLVVSEHNKINFQKAGCPLCVKEAVKAISRSKYKYAIKLFEYSLKLQPKDTQTRSLLALAYHATGNDKKALLESKRALADDPESLWSLLVAGSTLQIKKDYVGALKYFEIYLKVAPKKHKFYDDIRRICRLIRPKAKYQLRRELEKLNKSHNK